METQYLYNQNDIKINEIQRFVICYRVTYSQSIEFEKEGIKCINIEYTKDDRNKYGNTIPNNVKSIGENCFEYNTEIKSIEIPSSVTSLQDYCFDHCTSLSEIKLPFGLKIIPNYCFYSCQSLKTIEIPQQVSVLKSFCFYGCSTLSTINLPSLLKELSTGCFYNCKSLKSINLPSSLQLINQKCFFNCNSLKSINGQTCFKLLDKDENNYIRNDNGFIIPSLGLTLGYNCFFGCYHLSNYSEIPETIHFEIFNNSYAKSR